MLTRRETKMEEVERKPSAKESLTPCWETLLTSWQSGENRGMDGRREGARGGRSTTATCEGCDWHLDVAVSFCPRLASIHYKYRNLLVCLHLMMSSPFSRLCITPPLPGCICFLSCSLSVLLLSSTFSALSGSIPTWVNRPPKHLICKGLATLSSQQNWCLLCDSPLTCIYPCIETPWNEPEMIYFPCPWKNNNNQITKSDYSLFSVWWGAALVYSCQTKQWCHGALVCDFK